MKVTHTLYPQVISIENLFQAWDEFKKGKKGKYDVQNFEQNLEDNLFNLQHQLKTKTYQHGSYTAFNIYDPKFRHINKAKVLDRVVHHAVVDVIGPIFDKTFVYDSYSCRVNKGTHKAVKRLFKFIRKISKNYTGKCFCLKLDIRKFFENIDHDILMKLTRKKIEDENLLWLIENILKSFSDKKGVPIGNLTSQLIANIYLNELDQFIKHQLKIKYYLRYTDDFVIVTSKKEELDQLIPKIGQFLKTELKLSIHEHKIIIRKYNQGIDFLGYIVLPYYILPRTKTKRRVFKKLKEKVNSVNFNQSLQSYLGYLSHANSFKVQQKLLNQIGMTKTGLKLAHSD